jgi:hypothetical protein
MNQVRADRMEPRRPPPLREKVIFPLIVNQTVEIVDPPLVVIGRIELILVPVPRRKVKLRPERLVIQRLPPDRRRLLGAEPPTRQTPRNENRDNELPHAIVSFSYRTNTILISISLFQFALTDNG